MNARIFMATLSTAGRRDYFSIPQKTIYVPGRDSRLIVEIWEGGAWPNGKWVQKRYEWRGDKYEEVGE